MRRMNLDLTSSRPAPDMEDSHVSARNSVSLHLATGIERKEEEKEKKRKANNRNSSFQEYNFYVIDW